MLKGDKKTTRRRWLVALTLLTFIVISLIATSQWHRRRPREFPLPGTDFGHAPSIQIKEFVKPKGVKIVGLVFFGRRNRVEMLRCYIEVCATYLDVSTATDVLSVIWLIMVDGWTKSIG